MKWEKWFLDVVQWLLLVIYLCTWGIFCLMSSIISFTLTSLNIPKASLNLSPTLNNEKENTTVEYILGETSIVIIDMCFWLGCHHFLQCHFNGRPHLTILWASLWKFLASILIIMTILDKSMMCMELWCKKMQNLHQTSAVYQRQGSTRVHAGSCWVMDAFIIAVSAFLKSTASVYSKDNENHETVCKHCNHLIHSRQQQAPKKLKKSDIISIFHCKKASMMPMLANHGIGNHLLIWVITLT